MAKNTLTLAVFAFESINAADYISVMTRQRMSDGKYELPSYDFDEFEGTNEDVIRKHLSQSINLPEQPVSFPIGTYPGNDSIVTAYGVFLDERPDDAFGINWMIIAPEGALRKPLDEGDEKILADGKKALTMQVLCGPYASFSPESKKRLMDLFVPKEALKQMAAQLDGHIKVDVSGLGDVPDEDLRTALASRLKDDDKDKNKKVPKYHIYEHFHPDLAVDIVPLAINAYTIDKVDFVDLNIPLVLRDKGPGAGTWGLPGGFVSKDDFINAGWSGEEVIYDPNSFLKYRNNLKKGKRAIRMAATNNLEDKTGISLDDDATLYPLALRDNPMRGTADDVPVVAETLLTVIGDYEKYINLNHKEKSNVLDQRWFTIKLLFYDENGKVIKEGAKPADKSKVSLLSSDKHSSYDLRFNPDETDIFILGDNLMINYFRGEQVPFSSREGIDTSKTPVRLFADHGDAIIDALQYVKEKTLTSTILADFLMKTKDELDPRNIFKIGYFEQLFHTLLFPEDKLRQTLQATALYNGLLVKPEGNPHAKYRFDLEKFEEFVYKNMSIF